MNHPDTEPGAQLLAEPSRGGPAPKRARRRGIAAVSFGVFVVIAAAAGVAAAHDGGSDQGTEGPDHSPQAAVVAPTTAEDKIASAMLAAPVAVAKEATILDFPGKDLKYPVLRAGTNGWSCFADWEVTPVEDPMCGDRNAIAWLDAYYAGKTPTLKAAGILYMLHGSGDFSRTDATATELAPGQDWVNDGPHITIVSPGTIDPKDYASEGTAAPWVMWAGSPYAHIHVPLR